MSTPWRSAACRIVSPAKAEIVSPFSLNSMVSAFEARSFIFMRSYLVPEMLRHAADRIRRRLPEAADRGVGHRDRQVLEELAIPLRRLHQVGGLHGAGAARRALAARLVGEELHHVERGIARAVVLREHD